MKRAVTQSNNAVPCDLNGNMKLYSFVKNNVVYRTGFSVRINRVKKFYSTPSGSFGIFVNIVTSVAYVESISFLSSVRVNESGYVIVSEKRDLLSFKLGFTHRTAFMTLTVANAIRHGINYPITRLMAGCIYVLTFNVTAISAVTGKNTRLCAGCLLNSTPRGV